MPSYFITGASRGIGFEFLRQLSNKPEDTVIGLVRDKAATELKVAKELDGRTNIHLVEADVSDYSGLKRAAEATSKITGGRLDYLIANAAAMPKWSAFDSLGDLGNDPKKLEGDILDTFKVNALANVHLINLFMPLILKGDKKKVIAISTGHADTEVAYKWGSVDSAPYALSKAALNMVVAKFSAQYAPEGVLVIAISPGFVETGQFNGLTPDQMQKAVGISERFKKYAPDFTGPISTEESVKAMRGVWEKASVENGDGGTFVSHHGDRNWL